MTLYSTALSSRGLIVGACAFPDGELRLEPLASVPLSLNRDSWGCTAMAANDILFTLTRGIK